MRTVRLSKTFDAQLIELLDQGEPKFGRILVDAKKELVFAAIEYHIAEFPDTARLDPLLNLYARSVARTPFIVIFDFDDTELRVHFIVHRHADRSLIDPADIEW